MRCCLLSAR